MLLNLGCGNVILLWDEYIYVPKLWLCPLQAVRYLAECHQNKEKMRGELGMLLSLQNVMQK